MQTNRIEELFYDMTNTEEYFKAAAEAGEELLLGEDVKERIGEETYMDIEESLNLTNINYERFGFVNGFKLAFKIAQEVYAK